MLQVIFHGVDRSPAAEADITDRFEALKRFDNSMTECKATITKVGRQGLGEFSVKLDIVVGGGRTIVASENDPDAMCAINKVFDTVRRTMFCPQPPQRTMPEKRLTACCPFDAQVSNFKTSCTVSNSFCGMIASCILGTLIQPDSSTSRIFLIL